jgi:small ubiquitin-related modifier
MSNAGNVSNADNLSSTEGEIDYVRLKVVDQDSTNEIHFRVRMSALMGKLMTAYTDRVGASENSFRFLFDGRRINKNETPKQLGLEQDDIISVFQEQKGGCDRP